MFFMLALLLFLSWSVFVFFSFRFRFRLILSLFVSAFAFVFVFVSFKVGMRWAVGGQERPSERGRKHQPELAHAGQGHHSPRGAPPARALPGLEAHEAAAGEPRG